MAWARLGLRITDGLREHDELRLGQIERTGQASRVERRHAPLDSSAGRAPGQVPGDLGPAMTEGGFVP